MDIKVLKWKESVLVHNFRWHRSWVDSRMMSQPPEMTQGSTQALWVTVMENNRTLKISALFLSRLKGRLKDQLKNHQLISQTIFREDNFQDQSWVDPWVDSRVDSSFMSRLNSFWQHNNGSIFWSTEIRIHGLTTSSSL